MPNYNSIFVSWNSISASLLLFERITGATAKKLQKNINCLLKMLFQFLLLRSSLIIPSYQL